MHNFEAQNSKETAAFDASTVRIGVPSGHPAPPCGPSVVDPWANAAIELVPLASIDRRWDVQPRGAPGRGRMPSGDRAQVAKGALKADTINQYAHRLINGEVPPPVFLARYRGQLILVDGYHRVAAALKAAFSDTIPARVAAIETITEIRWHAFRVNLGHGLPIPAPSAKTPLRLTLRLDSIAIRTGS